MNTVSTNISLTTKSSWEWLGCSNVRSTSFFVCRVRLISLLDDPEFPNYKANYRDFLRETSHYHQPIPIRDEMIQRKIHHTYRLQFLKDVVLARAIDDSTFNVLNSSIIFNQIDIINHIQNDMPFLREVVESARENRVAGNRERLKRGGAARSALVSTEDKSAQARTKHQPES